MWLRKDYMNGACSHSEYYEQFVTRKLILFLQDNIWSLISDGYDDEFENMRPKDILDLPIAEWDLLGHLYFDIMNNKPDLNLYGDTYCDMWKICTLKVAALFAIFDCKYEVHINGKKTIILTFMKLQDAIKESLNHKDCSIKVATHGSYIEKMKAKIEKTKREGKQNEK